MRLIIYNSFKFLILIVLFLHAVDFFFPYYIGNQVFREKVPKYKKGRYQVVFFGSSQVYRQINPTIIDSVLLNNEGSTFNFGAPASFNPEAYYLTRKFIQEIDSGSLQTIVMQLQDLSDIDPANSKTFRGYYWSNLNELKYTLKYCYYSNLDKSRRVKMSAKYIISFFYKQVDITRLRIYFEKSTQTLLGSDIPDNGFVPHNLDDKGLNLKIEELGTYARESDILNNQIIAETPQNIAHVRYLEDLFLEAKAKGITLYFLLAPRSMDYTYAVEILGSIPRERIISLASEKNYPDLYANIYSFDRAHLNKKGANIFSLLVAQKLSELSKN